MEWLSRRWARRLFWLVLTLLTLPGVWAIATIFISRGMGCATSGELNDTCHTFGQSLHNSLELNLLVIALNAFTLFLPLWVLVFLVKHGFTGWRRDLIALTSLWWIPNANLFFGSIALDKLKHLGCDVKYAECIAFGTDVGVQTVFHYISFLLWRMTIPMCVVSTGLYCLSMFYRKQS